LFRNGLILRLAAGVILLLAACGGNSSEYDTSGFAAGDDDAALFSRGSQQYFRGNLTAAHETFNSLIYRFPESRMKSDAQLAVRRIDSELTGVEEQPVETDTGERVVFPSVAIVGKPGVTSTVSQLELLILETGTPPITAQDNGAPDVTLVLYPQGFQDEAVMLSDSLARWLSSHSSVPVQPGGDIIAAVAPQHMGVVVVLGSDAVVDASLLRNRYMEDSQ